MSQKDQILLPLSTATAATPERLWIADAGIIRMKTSWIYSGNIFMKLGKNIINNGDTMPPAVLLKKIAE